MTLVEGKLGSYLCSLCIHFRCTPGHGDALVPVSHSVESENSWSHQNKKVRLILLHESFLCSLIVALLSS